MVATTPGDVKAADAAAYPPSPLLTGGFSARAARCRRGCRVRAARNCARLASRQPGKPGIMSILDKITGRAKKARGGLYDDDPSLRREGRQEERKVRPRTS